jgi:hypothetical protein
MKVSAQCFLPPALALLLLAASACGTEDSDPPLFNEARFEVIPQGGETTFEVLSLIGGTSMHTFPEGTTFTSSATFNFFLENAPPAYTGTFRKMDGAEIRVCLSVGEQIFVNCADTDPQNPTVTVAAGDPPDNGAEPQVPNPEVRFDVCAPNDGENSCNVAEAVGRFVDFTGTIGDARVTHLLRRTTNAASLLKTPSIYFLEGAEDEVSGVFRGAASLPLFVELLVNGAVKDRAFSSGDVIVREDL